MSHFGLMVVYAGMVALFFGALLRQNRGEILRLSAKIFFFLAGGSLAAAWLMYPFPS